MLSQDANASLAWNDSPEIRRAELARVAAASASGVPVVICGLPGMGKTALAHAAAQQLRGGPGPHARYVDLGATDGASLDVGGVRDLLQRSDDLVILDNADRALPAVEALLEAAGRGELRGRLIVVTRTEPAVSSTPVLVRLQPLDDATARALIEEFAARLAVARVDVDATLRRGHGSPGVLRQLVLRGSAGAVTAPIAEAIAALSPFDRASLVAVASAARWGIAIPPCVERLVPASFERLRRASFIEFDGAAITSPALVRELVLAVATADEVRAAQAMVAGAVRQWADADPSPINEVAAITASALAGEGAVAEARLAKAFPAIQAAGLDDQLLAGLARLADDGSVAAGLGQARVLLRMGRVDEAAAMLERRVADPRVLDDGHFHALRGAVARRQARLTDARRAYQDARERLPPGSERAQVDRSLADVLAMKGRCAEAREVLRELERGPHASVRDRLRLRWSWAMTLIFEHRFEEALEALVTSRAEVAASGGADLAFAHATLTVMAASECGRVDAARAAMASLDVLGASHPLRAEVLDFYGGVVASAAGEVRVASALLERAMSTRLYRGELVLATLAGQYLVRARLAMGDATGAVAVAERHTRAAEEAGCAGLVPGGRLDWARAQVAAGRLADAVAVLGPLADHPWIFVRAAATMIRARCAGLEGDLPAARALARQALADAGEREPLRSELMIDACELETWGGNPEVVIAGARVALGRATTTALPQLRIRAELVLAAGLLGRGADADRAACAPLLTDAVARAQALGLVALQEWGGFLTTVLERPAGSGPALVPLMSRGGAMTPGMAALLRFLGVGPRRYWIEVRGGSRSGDDDDVATERQRRELTIDTVAGALASRQVADVVEGRPALVLLLAALARGDGRALGAEELYRAVWGAEYHPLRHRNTLYSALSRAKKALDGLLPGRAHLIRIQDGWALDAALDVCVIASAPPATR